MRPRHRFVVPLSALLLLATACVSRPEPPAPRPVAAEAAPSPDAPPLKVLEPVLGETPDISTTAQANLARLKVLYERIDSVVRSYPNYETAREHLTPRQIEIWENEDAVNRDDHLDIGPVGCSWYCGGGPDSIRTSSALPPAHGFRYDGDNAHDFSLRTAWVEGAPGAGTGERITYRFPAQSPPVTTVELFNGYMKSEKTWGDNARIKQLKLYVNGRPQALLNLKDTRARQRFAIGSYGAGDTPLELGFEITAVYPGARYEDAALAELEFDGTGVHCFAAGTAVATPSGSRAIENLQAGDEVLSLREPWGVLDTVTVLGLARQRHHNLYELQFGATCLTATDDHPFWWGGRWYSVRANAAYDRQTLPLVPGQPVAFLQDGVLRPRRLTALRALKRCETTYTITRLSRGSHFFANGACVAAEADQSTAFK